MQALITYTVKRAAGSLAFLMLLSMCISSCYYDKQDELYVMPSSSNCDTINVTYASTVKPIIANNCATSGCHDGSNYSAYPLNDYSALKINCVDAGKLIGSLRHEAGYVAMPQNAPKLDECSINKIAAWVHNGAQNN